VPCLLRPVLADPPPLGLGHGRTAQGVLARETAAVERRFQCGQRSRLGGALTPLGQAPGEADDEAEAVLEVARLGLRG